MNRQKLIMFIKCCIFSLLVVCVASYALTENKDSNKDITIPSKVSNKLLEDYDEVITEPKSKSSKDVKKPKSSDEPLEDSNKKPEKEVKVSPKDEDKMKKKVEELKKSKNVDTSGCQGGGDHDFGVIKEFVHVDGCVRIDEGNCVLNLGKVANIKFAFTATEEMTKATSITYGFCGIAFFNFCIPDPKLKKINFCDKQIKCPLEKGKSYVVSVEKELPNLPMGFNLVAQVSLKANGKNVGCVKMPLQLIK